MAGPDVVARTIVQRGGNQRVLTLLRPWILGLDDDQFFLYDGTDETKRVRFQLEDVPTGTDLTFRFPAAGGSIVASGVSVQTDVLTFILNGQGSFLSPGVAGDLYVAYGCTIIEARAGANTVGGLVVDVWARNDSGFPPVDANSITGTTPITIVADDLRVDTTLTNWSPTLAAGTWLRFNVDSCSGISRCTLALTVRRTIGD